MSGNNERGKKATEWEEEVKISMHLCRHIVRLVAATEIEPTTTDPLSKCQSYLFPKEQFLSYWLFKLLRSHSWQMYTTAAAAVAATTAAVVVWSARLRHYAHVWIKKHQPTIVARRTLRASFKNSTRNKHQWQWKSSGKSLFGVWC